MYLSEFKYETLHNRLFQDKEMTVRHDRDQSERVPAEHSSPVFIIFTIIYIFKRDLNYIHYIQCLTNVLKHMYVMFLTNDVRFVPLLL